MKYIFDNIRRNTCLVKNPEIYNIFLRINEKNKEINIAIKLGYHQEPNEVKICSLKEFQQSFRYDDLILKKFLKICEFDKKVYKLSERVKYQE